MRSRFVQLFALLLSLLVIPPTFGLDTHLSDEAIREAYFLGQHHDQSVANVLNRYVKVLPPPASGPYVFSVALFTPYALAVSDSNQRSFNYSAQQAELDHRHQPEIVRVVMQVLLTGSYGPYLTQPTGSRYGSPIGIAFRRVDFWNDFRVHVFSANRKEQTQVLPVDASGQPTYRCDDQGGCILTGATIQFDFPADSFTSDSASIRVDPPEGDPISLDFDLSSLR